MTELPTPPTGTDPVDVKCQCAQLWSHPMARLLVGDALRPGGTGLTSTLVTRLALPVGAHVLDVGSGTGTTLRLLHDRGLAAVGVDYSAALAGEASRHGPVAVGDAERLPFTTDSFDAALMECVLSAVPDKAAALDAARRVLRPGGRIALADVTLTGGLAEPLSTLVAWLACTGGALPPDGYPALLEDRGFTIRAVEDRRDDLRSLVSKIRRRFALLAGAVGTGIVDQLDAGLLPGGDQVPTDDPASLLEAGRDTLAQLADAVEDGRLGYLAVVASA